MTNLENIAAPVAKLRKEYGQTVAVAESASGGLICAALLGVGGASAYFKGGGAVYTGSSKQILMGVSDQAMAADRAATENHALHLARAASQRLDAHWGIGETGAAGPTGNRYGDPPGHTCIGVAGPLCRTTTLQTGMQNRTENMAAFASAALSLLQICIEEYASHQGL